MAVGHVSLITKPLDKHSFRRDSLLHSFLFMTSVPTYQETYLLCIISLRNSVAVKKSLKIVTWAVFAPTSVLFYFLTKHLTECSRKVNIRQKLSVRHGNSGRITGRLPSSATNYHCDLNRNGKERPLQEICCHD